MPPNNIVTNNSTAVLSANESAQARHLANSVASWYLATLDPYAPHSQNIGLRLRHPVHVVTRCILYGNIGAIEAGGTEELEALFNDDDAEIKDGGPDTLTRRSYARMEAFLASCAAALRGVDDDHHHDPPPTRELVGVKDVNGGSSNKDDDNDNNKKGNISASPSRTTSTASNSSKTPLMQMQIDHGELLLRLDVYCRTLRRIRSIADANETTTQLEECVIQYEPKKTIRTRVKLIVQTFLGNVDCVRDVRKTLMSLILKATLEVLAVEIWCEELSSMVDRLASEYEHKVSFGSLAFLSSPDNSVVHLAPLLIKYFEYLQKEWMSLVSKCEIERMLRTILDTDLRHFFKTVTWHSVGHILDVCREERRFLDNIALPPPWKEGVFGGTSGGGGGNTNKDMDAAINSYCSDASLVTQALRDLRREVITVNGQILSPAQSVPELAEYLGQILNSSQMKKSLGDTRAAKSKRRSSKKRVTNYTSDFGLESESDFFSGNESDSTAASRVDVGLVDVLARRLLIAASRTGAGGDAYYVVRDLFGGDEVEVVPHHSSGRVKQGSIEIIVKMTSAIIKSHAKFDIFAKPCGDSDPLIQFHTTTTENITLQQSVDGMTVLLKEKRTKMTGWRTLAIRPAYYEHLPHKR